MFRIAATALALSLAIPAQADEISDTIQSALDAYNEGDAAYALEELKYAEQLLAAAKQDDLIGYLPAPQDGWTREVNTEMAAGMAAFGGGAGAEANYANEAGDSFTLTYMADNPMVMSMTTLFANPALAGGKMVRVGRQKFIDQDGQLMGLIANRIMIQVEGNQEAAISHLEDVDFKALAGFGL